MSRPSLTVLTLPILPAPRRVYQSLRGAVRSVVKPGVPVPGPSRYPGHYALVRSVVEGLRSIGADFNFNPRTFGDLARVVYAPANEALRQAIELKRRGVVDYVVAGPVNALFADESGGILLTPEIDLVIVPSEWTVDFYEGFPELVAKSRVCPCGVDAEAWKPAGVAKERSAVVYWKSGDERFCEAVEAIVRRCGLEPLRDPVTARRAQHLQAVRLPRGARPIRGRRLPEHLRNAGHRAGRSVVDGRARGRVGSSGRGGVARPRRSSRGRRHRS